MPDSGDYNCLAALVYTEDAVFVGGDSSGPHYGREAIEKILQTGFKQFHFSNHLAMVDQYS
jgi:ketosteroid isomerase-like protein